MSGASFTQKLAVERTDLVCLLLREGVQAVQERRGEAILDLNLSGNWVRGFEMIGGFVPFSIARAVSPFNPIHAECRRFPETGKVTYDPEADAAFVYLEYDSRFANLAPREQAELRAVSHSVNPMVIYGLDQLGGLVYLKIPVADLTGSVDQFVQLLRRA